MSTTLYEKPNPDKHMFIKRILTCILLCILFYCILCLFFCFEFNSTLARRKYVSSNIRMTLALPTQPPLIYNKPSEVPIKFETLRESNGNQISKIGYRYYLTSKDVPSYWKVCSELSISVDPYFPFTTDAPANTTLGTEVFKLYVETDDDSPSTDQLASLTLGPTKQKGRLEAVLKVDSNHTYYIYVACRHSGRSYVQGVLSIIQIA